MRRGSIGDGRQKDNYPIPTYTCVQIVLLDRINLRKPEMNEISLLINTYGTVLSFKLILCSFRAQV